MIAHATEGSTTLRELHVTGRPNRSPGRGFGSATILVAALLVAPILGAPAAAAAPAANAPAPPFTLPTRTGSVALDSLRGKVVLVDFWASWCGPCQKSFPWMADVYRRYAGKGLEIVAINLDKGRDAAEDFLRAHPAPFTVAFDPSGSVAKAYKVWGMPTSFLIDPAGRVVLAHSGFDPKHSDQVEAAIKAECAP